MIVKKSTSALSPEERLKNALVPADEQPYEVPENWYWATIESVNHYKRGSIDPSKEPQKVFELYSVPSSTDNYPEIVCGEEIGSSKQAVQKGDVLLCKINPRINRVWKVSKHTENTLLASSEWIIVRNEIINTDYLMWCLQSKYFREYMLSNVSGVGGSLMRAQPKFVQKYPIPIAPLAEQKRIVDTIADLFADLDKAAENVQQILVSAEDRRANILHRAVSGELTREWRSTKGLSIKDWDNCSIDDLCSSLKYGTAKKSQKSGPVVVLRMGNMQEGEIDWTDLAYTDDAEDIAKYHLEPGDVLFNRTNSATHVGKTSIYRGEYPAIYAGYLIKLDYDHSRVIGNYLTYALNTPTAREYCQSVKTDGVNQSNINARKIGAFTIPLPSIEEQAEIVRILDELLADEQRIKEAAEETLAKIDLMKKSILADAFRGKLGTNDPTDEPATELLKQILT